VVQEYILKRAVEEAKFDLQRLEAMQIKLNELISLNTGFYESYPKERPVNATIEEDLKDFHHTLDLQIEAQVVKIYHAEQAAKEGDTIRLKLK
jgi:hypothetical protein